MPLDGAYFDDPYASRSRAILVEKQDSAKENESIFVATVSQSDQIHVY